MSRQESQFGTVYLVGAGPGDPGLVTVKGLRCLESADVVVYDRLVNKRLLGVTRPDAELINVGKVPGDQPDKQSNINSILVEKAKAGNQVVRLKGGDPFVFGRGGEEAEALASENVSYEIVPGLTSAIAAPAYAGIPITHRNYASTFTVLTGSESIEKPGSNSIPWDQLAHLGGTLVVLMGWERLEIIINKLLTAGCATDTPVALIQWGSENYQKTLTGTLSDIVERAIQAEFAAPVTVVIGEVVRLSNKLRWFDSGPLAGKRVLVTRSRDQASKLSELLAISGAEPIELPTIKIRHLERNPLFESKLKNLADYNWIVFTSTNSVDALFDRLNAIGLDSRALHRCAIAAIGSATGARLLTKGISADLLPGTSRSESMLSALLSMIQPSENVLFPRADIAQTSIQDGLVRAGISVDDVVAYNTVIPESSKLRINSLLANGVDILTFTSSSTVQNFVNLLDGKLDNIGSARVACIGPVTALTAQKMGISVDIIAQTSSISGLVTAIKNYYHQEN